MARVAVLVDAGYLIARGAEALGAQPVGRRGVILDEGSVINTLVSFAETQAKCPGGILRVYWYDAAGTQPTAEQIRLAELDNVKLRLGTFNSLGQQKGVDSLIIADMIELARNEAIGDFVLVGGDEDLRVGVQVAQTYGIRVHLLGIAIGNDKAQSAGLAREADTNCGWTVTEIASFLSVRPVLAPSGTQLPVAATPATTPTLGVGMASAHQTAQALYPITHLALETAAKAFYATLIQPDIDDIRTVFAASGNIPQPHDGRLLASTGAALGRLLDFPEKREMRRVFTGLL